MKKRLIPALMTILILVITFGALALAQPNEPIPLQTEPPASQSGSGFFGAIIKAIPGD